MKKRIILKRLLLSTAVLTIASAAILAQQQKEVIKTEQIESKTKDINKKSEKEENVLKNNVEKDSNYKKEDGIVNRQCELDSTKYNTYKVTAEHVKQLILSESYTPEVQPALTELVVPTENPQPEQPIVPETPFVSEKGEALVQPELPKYHESKGEPEVQPVLTELVVPTENPQPEQPIVPETPFVSEKGEALVQPALPEFTTPAEIPSKPAEQPKVEQPVTPEAPVVAEKGEPLVQPELPEFHAENGEALVQPELPEFHAETGDALVQPELPEATVPAETPTTPETPAVEQPVVPEAPKVEQPVVSEKGEPLVQPELPEYHEAKGTPEVQPELPEFHFETGDALVQPELPEYHEQKGEPEVQPELSEYTIKTVTREEVIPVPAESVTVTNPELNEGETEIVTQPKDGSITRTYEDVLDEHDNVLSTKLVNETRVEAIKGVTSIGTKPVKKVFGEEGNYRFSEHLADENILEFREDVKLSADEIHALGQDEINKRTEQNLENTITVQDKTRPNVSSIDSAPLSDETITKLNSDTYINHKNIGLKVLELVNAERKRLGVHELTWSDPLYTLTKVRANEVRENGSIRFYTEDGQALKHVRDNKGTKWHTVKEGTEFEDSAMGENLASYGIRPNIYKAFSEKYIAEQLYEQWKDSPHHYANMIKEKFNQFAFDVAYSTFWRDGYNDINYKQQGVLGVQLFAD